MEVKVCKNCRKLFKYMFGPELCHECSKIIKEEKNNNSEQNDIKAKNVQVFSVNKPLNKSIRPLVADEELKYEQVRDYIMTHPGVSVAKIAEDNDVLPTKIFEWIRGERLEFSDNSEYAWFKCEKCGTRIRSGRICHRCKTIK